MHSVVSHRRDRERRATRDALARLVALASLLAVVATFIAGGRRYFYCAWMDRSSESSCCAPEGAPPDVTSIDELDDDCCEARSTAVLAPGLGDAAIDAWPAPLAREVAVVVPSALDAVSASIAGADLDVATPIRAGPGSPEARALLQVYLS